jgi:hypothetical protein
VLAIYGPRGDHRRLLFQGPAIPGIQVHPWDGRDDRGHGLPAGVYWVRIAAGGKIATSKLVVAR